MLPRFFTPDDSFPYHLLSEKELDDLNRARERAESADLAIRFEVDGDTGEMVARCQSQTKIGEEYTVRVCEENGMHRLVCNCPAAFYRRVWTCTHAQAVWLRIHRMRKSGTRKVARTVA